MLETVRPLISAEDVQKRIIEVAEEINRDYGSKPVHLICILKGGAVFLCELAKYLKMPVSFDFMSVSSYRGTQSTGIVRIMKDLDEPLENKNVIIVEDIIDTGRTLNHLKGMLLNRNPNSIRICTLLDKPAGRVEKEVTVDYSAFRIPDKFVVGYGLDYNQKYRNLPYIGVVEFQD